MRFLCLLFCWTLAVAFATPTEAAGKVAPKKQDKRHDAQGKKPASGDVLDLVVIHESHNVLPDKWPAVSEAFAELLAKTMGRAPGSIKVSFFAEAETGEAYAKKAKAGLVIASARPYVHFEKATAAAEGKKKDPRKMLFVAQAVDLRGEDYVARVIAKGRSQVGVNVHQTPGFRVAAPFADDVQWLNVLFDGLFNPATHFKLTETASYDEAVAAVAAGTADAAIIDDKTLLKIEGRMKGKDPELKLALNTSGLVRPVFLAFPAFLKAKELKRLQESIDGLCKGDNAKICSPFGFIGFLSGASPRHNEITYKYLKYKLL